MLTVISGDDEMMCEGDLHCPHMLHCYSSNMCVPPWEVCDGVQDCMVLGEDESTSCDLQCPEQCQCHDTIAICSDLKHQSLHQLQSAKYIALQSEILNFRKMLSSLQDTINNGLYFELIIMHSNDVGYKFKDVKIGQVDFVYLKLIDCNIASLSDNFIDSQRLLSLNLSYNVLSFLSSQTFKNISTVEIIDLSYNVIQVLQFDYFSLLYKLRVLLLTGNFIINVDKDVFMHNENLVFVRSNFYYICCLLNLTTDCVPVSDAFSSCSNLLNSWFLRVFNQLQSLIIFGNIAVFTHTYMDKRQSNTMERHLAVGEFLCAVYLITLTILDVFYMGRLRDVFVWLRGSIICEAAALTFSTSMLASLYLRASFSLLRATTVSTVNSAATIKKKLPKIVISIWGSIAIFICFLVMWYAFVEPFESHWNLCVLMGKWGSESFSSVGNFINIYIALSILVSTTIMIASNVLVFSIVSKSQKRIRSDHSHAHGSISSGRVLRSMVIMISPSIVTCGPLLILLFTDMSGVRIPDGFLQWIIILCIPANAAVNPLLYAIRIRKTNKAKKKQNKQA